MATVKVTQSAPPYYTLRVEFDGLTFDQTIVSDKTGAELLEQVQAYADDYERDWAAGQAAQIDPDDANPSF